MDAVGRKNVALGLRALWASCWAPVALLAREQGERQVAEQTTPPPMPGHWCRPIQGGQAPPSQAHPERGTGQGLPRSSRTKGLWHQITLGMLN